MQLALAARGAHAGLPVGVPGGVLRPGRGRKGVWAPVLHAAQDPGGPPRRAPRVRRPAGARDGEGHGRLGGPAREGPHRRAVAGDAADRVRRDAGVADGSLRRHPATPSTCGSPGSSTTASCSTRSRAARTRSTACTRTRRSRRRSAPSATASSRATPRYCRGGRDASGSRWRSHRSYAIGGHSEDEHFFPVAHFSRHLGESTAETCNTYNMLKLTRRLFLRDGLPVAASSSTSAASSTTSSPRTTPPPALVTYYVVDEAGRLAHATRRRRTRSGAASGPGWRTRRASARRSTRARADALYVNLFLASELAWREKGLRLRQETRFPEQDSDAARACARRAGALRAARAPPGWATAGFAVSVNGQPQPVDGRARLVRRRSSASGATATWSSVRLPMRLRVEPMPDDASVVAFLQGPIVLAADLGGAGLDAAKRYRPVGARAARGRGCRRCRCCSPRRASEALATLQPGGEPLDVPLRGHRPPGRRRAAAVLRPLRPAPLGLPAGRDGSGARRARGARADGGRSPARAGREDGRRGRGGSRGRRGGPRPGAGARSAPGRSRAAAAAARATAGRGATRSACPGAAPPPCAWRTGEARRAATASRSWPRARRSRRSRSSTTAPASSTRSSTRCPSGSRAGASASASASAPGRRTRPGPCSRCGSCVRPALLPERPLRGGNASGGARPRRSRYPKPARPGGAPSGEM